jgi:hypothetical protein
MNNIKQLITNNDPLIITSDYKGINLTQLVHVLDVQPEQVTFQPPDPKLCLNFKDRIELFDRDLHDILSAQLLAINMIQGEMVLADFNFTGRHWNERQEDRVQPREPIYVETEHKKTLVRAGLDNLSVGGMSLMIYKETGKPFAFEQDAVVRLHLKLPGVDNLLDLKGKVIHERQTGRLNLLGLQLKTSLNQEKLIHQYVQQRKAEILIELDQVSREFLYHQSMPYLYYS